MQDDVTRRGLTPERTGTYDSFEDDEQQSSNRFAALIGGTAVAVSGAMLAAYALRERSWRAAGVAIAAPLVYRQATGNWPVPRTLADRAASHPAPIETSLTIGRPRQELYDFWRRFENLPRFMEHLDSVTDLGNGRSRWVARSPLGFHVEWEAEIIEDRPGQILSWRSLPGAQVHNAGSVLFEDAPGDRGTIVRISFEMQPAGALLGRALGKVLSPITEQQVREDLRRFKRLVEAGEIPTTDGQPHGRRAVVNIHNPF